MRIARITAARILPAAAVVLLGIALSSCGASTHKTSAGAGGCPAGEQRNGALNCVSTHPNCPFGTEQNAAGQCMPVSVAPQTTSASSNPTPTTASPDDYRHCVNNAGLEVTQIQGCASLLNPDTCQSLLQPHNGATISCRQAMTIAAVAAVLSLANGSNVGTLDVRGYQCYSGDQGVTCSRSGAIQFVAQLP